MNLSQPTLPRPNPNSYWVTPSLLAGEYPHFIDEQSQQSPLSNYLAHGFSYFLDLRQREACPEHYDQNLPSHSPATGAPVIYHNIPIQDFGVPDNQQTMHNILQTIDTAINAGHKVYVHCWAGIGRTGMVVGCYLTRYGYNGDQALKKLQQLWQQCAKSDYQQSPETLAQMQWVINWTQIK